MTRLHLVYDDRRSPHGERGLKYDVLFNEVLSEPVAPLTGSVD